MFCHLLLCFCLKKGVSPVSHALKPFLTPSIGLFLSLKTLSSSNTPVFCLRKVRQLGILCVLPSLGLSLPQKGVSPVSHALKPFLTPLIGLFLSLETLSSSNTPVFCLKKVKQLGIFSVLPSLSLFLPQKGVSSVSDALKPFLTPLISLFLSLKTLSSSNTPVFCLKKVCGLCLSCLFIF
jgi:hypothetical protein